METTLGLQQRTLELNLVMYCATNFLEPESTRGLSVDDLDARMEVLGKFLGQVRHPQALEELFGIGAMHTDPYVRAAMVQFAARYFPTNTYAQNLITWLTHDPEDFVAFEAIRTCGALRLTAAIPDLMAISGRPSERLTFKSGKPVGVGHSVVIHALTSIFGTTNVDELRALEEKAMIGELADPSAAVAVGVEEYPSGAVSDIPGMVYVPAGPCTVGLTEEQVQTLDPKFDVSDISPPRTEHLKGFYIDIFPVTNAEYDKFLEDVKANGHRFCHPDEPPHKNHTRNTWRDSRYKPDHPVVGVDWYDAYAYARWAGKELPSEAEWEKAARGPQGYLFPWGNEFDANALNWAGRFMGTDEPPTLEEWREFLTTISLKYPQDPTTPVSQYPKNCSTYGVRDTVGNVWEWTRTNFFNREDMAPSFKGDDPVNFIGEQAAFATLRGGAWSNIPEITTTVFRGKDILTDRHNEIGFRCVLRRPLFDGTNE